MNKLPKYIIDRNKKTIPNRRKNSVNLNKALGTLGSPSIINPIVVRMDEMVKMFNSVFFITIVLDYY